MPTLILSPRFTEDSQLLWRAAGRLGWDVERLPSFRVPEWLTSVDEPVLYVEALMAPFVAEQFGLILRGPSEDWLPTLPEEYRRRAVRLTTLGKAREITEPTFVKPPNDKSFRAGVYQSGELPTEFPADMPVLVSEIVTWEKEFRCFLLDRQWRTFSVYLRHGELAKDDDYASTDDEQAEMRQFVESILADDRVPLPRAVVMDVGVIANRGWAVVELNAAWGSGLYGCDPQEVLHVLRQTPEPLDTQSNRAE